MKPILNRNPYPDWFLRIHIFARGLFYVLLVAVGTIVFPWSLTSVASSIWFSFFVYTFVWFFFSDVASFRQRVHGGGSVGIPSQTVRCIGRFLGWFLYHRFVDRVARASLIWRRPDARECCPWIAHPIVASMVLTYITGIWFLAVVAMESFFPDLHKYYFSETEQLTRWIWLSALSNTFSAQGFSNGGGDEIVYFIVHQNIFSSIFAFVSLLGMMIYRKTIFGYFIDQKKAVSRFISFKSDGSNFDIFGILFCLGFVIINAINSLFGDFVVKFFNALSFYKGEYYFYSGSYCYGWIMTIWALFVVFIIWELRRVARRTGSRSS